MLKLIVAGGVTVIAVGCFVALVVAIHRRGDLAEELVQILAALNSRRATAVGIVLGLGLATTIAFNIDVVLPHAARMNSDSRFLFVIQAAFGCVFLATVGTVSVAAGRRRLNSMGTLLVGFGATPVAIWAGAVLTPEGVAFQLGFYGVFIALLMIGVAIGRQLPASAAFDELIPWSDNTD